MASTLAGRCCTVMMYGQTGSGKTYTMSAVYERVAKDLFAGLENTSRRVFATFIELSGDKCSDMLNAGENCNLTQGFDGAVHPYPCVEVEVLVGGGSGVSCGHMPDVGGCGRGSSGVLWEHLRKLRPAPCSCGDPSRLRAGFLGRLHATVVSHHYG